MRFCAYASTDQRPVSKPALKSTVVYESASLIAPVARGVILGFGSRSYDLALQGLLAPAGELRVWADDTVTDEFIADTVIDVPPA